MNSEGYPAFVAWCIKIRVEPCGVQQYMSWSPQRFARWLREEQIKRDSPKVEQPTLF